MATASWEKTQKKPVTRRKKNQKQKVSQIKKRQPASKDIARGNQPVKKIVRVKKKCGAEVRCGSAGKPRA
jgi:hypothetical protein